MKSETVLRFNVSWSAGAMFLLVAAVIGIFVLSYLAQRRKLRPKLRNLLMGLRVAAALVLLYCIAQPFLRRSTHDRKKPHVAILLDVSRSMTVRNSKDGPDRYSRALAAARSLHEQLRGEYVTHLYAVGESAAPLGGLKDLDDLKPDADRTDLIQALESVAGELRAERLVAMFLLTDGAHNTGGDWDQALKAFAGGIPIYPIAFGEDSIRDLEIVGVRVDRKVSKDTLLNVIVDVRGSGFGTQEVPVSIRRKGREDGPAQLVQKRTVKLTPGAPTARATFEFLPDETGYLEYVVDVPAADREIVTDNNRRPFAVTVTKRPLRVLYMEGSEYRREGAELWEHQFLEEALKEDNIEVTTLLRKDAAKATEAGIYWVQHPEHGFPKTKKDLYLYDVIISSDIDKEFFTKKQLQNTRDFVSKHGGGFVMIGGWTAFGPGGYDESIIDDMLPVDMLGGRQERYGEWEEFTWQISEEGYHHPVMQLDSDRETNRKIWDEKQRPFSGHNKVQRAKPAATVLAVHPEDDNLYGQSVLIAVQQYGRGRSMAFTTDTTAGWGTLFEEEFGEEDPDTGKNDTRYFKRFWQNAVRWLALYRLNAPNKLAYIELDSNLYAQGQKTTLRVNALTNEYEPTHDARIDLTVTYPDGRKQLLKLEKDHARPGLYVREVSFDQVGRYEFSIYASLKGNKLSADRVMVYARKADLEFENFAMNRTLLERIADATGARFFLGREAELASSELRGTQHIVTRHTDRDIWDRWYVLALILTLLSAEWFLRKRAGLA